MNEENKFQLKSYLVDNWRAVMVNAWSIWAAVAGLVTPELLQVLADQVLSLPWFDEGTKNLIRAFFLVLVVLVRPLAQSKTAEGS